MSSCLAEGNCFIGYWDDDGSHGDNNDNDDVDGGSVGEDKRLTPSFFSETFTDQLELDML